MQKHYKHTEVTDKILRSFYNVYNALGYGFLEKVYENAMLIELRDLGLSVQNQVPIKVFYKGQKVGEYFADLLVEHKVVVELKAVDLLANSHEAQLINYLKATAYEVGLLLNFGPKPEHKRKAYENARKRNI